MIPSHEKSSMANDIAVHSWAGIHIYTLPPIIMIMEVENGALEDEFSLQVDPLNQWTKVDRDGGHRENSD